MTPEGKVKEMVKLLLKEHDCYWHMPVQMGMGQPALDFHVCHIGRYCGIETKAPGKKLTARQSIVRKQIEASGGKVFVIDSAESLQELQAWLLGLL